MNFSSKSFVDVDKKAKILVDLFTKLLADMTSNGLGEMCEGDSADMCAGKFPLVLMGAEWRVSRVQTRERGPPSALVEIVYTFISDETQLG
jgi:hypothetical protein